MRRKKILIQVFVQGVKFGIVFVGTLFVRSTMDEYGGGG
jgi:hypothetical protein